jgi:hypothetical protein
LLKLCIFCHAPFPANPVLEHMPVARRVAFDPARGRLWCICTACQGWTLMPIEQRWEVLEELERITRSRAKLLLQGENIALLRSGQLDLIRIGRAGLREEAWWRYGDELARRSKHAHTVARRGKVISALAWTAIVGVPLWSSASGQWLVDRSRHKTLGKTAWSGLVHCRQCGQARAQLSFTELRDVHVLGDLSTLSLHLPCSCRRGAGARLTGVPAVHTLRRLLAYQNFAGAGPADVRHAAEFVESAADGAQLLDTLLPLHRSLAAATTLGMLTLEIALNHDVERQLLQMELHELELRWQQEEEIAAIADRELT